VTRSVFAALLLCYAASALADAAQKLFEGFAGAMFGPVQPLDALHYFLILPDSIGSGK
jgi:homoserine acetyltransferase